MMMMWTQAIFFDTTVYRVIFLKADFGLGSVLDWLINEFDRDFFRL